MKKGITNRQTVDMIAGKLAFETGNETMFAQWRTLEHSKVYTVYSYGHHFPMAVCETGDDKCVWYVNTDKFSATTSRHQRYIRQALRNTPSIPMDTNRLGVISQFGIVGLAAAVLTA